MIQILILCTVVISVASTTELPCLCRQDRNHRCPLIYCKVNSTRYMDSCGCCPRCGKVVDDICGGERWENGRCSRGLLCRFDSYELPIPVPRRGKCVAIFRRKVNELCGPAWQQGRCDDGLRCFQPDPTNGGVCIVPLKRNDWT